MAVGKAEDRVLSAECWAKMKQSAVGSR